MNKISNQSMSKHGSTKGASGKLPTVKVGPIGTKSVQKSGSTETATKSSMPVRKLFDPLAGP